jgi:hypothetical protein
VDEVLYRLVTLFVLAATIAPIDFPTSLEELFQFLWTRRQMDERAS